MDYQTITDYINGTAIQDDAQISKQNIIISEDLDYPVVEHTCTFFEMIYVLSGACPCRINQNVEWMYPGDLYILPPAAQRSVHTDDEGRILRIMIQPAAFMDIFPGILSGQNPLSNFLKRSIYQNNGERYLVFHTQQEEYVHRTILDMLNEMNDIDEYTDKIIAGMLLTLFGRLLRTHKDFVKSSHEDARIHEILSLIYDHYNTITLSSLAEHLHYTVPYCSKYLKQHLGSTFSELIRQIRFQKAESLLTHSGMTVTRISKELGYENLENFVRAFKHQYQMTPSQYRLSRTPKLPPPG